MSLQSDQSPSNIHSLKEVQENFKIRPFEPDSVKFSPKQTKKEKLPKLRLKLERIESIDSNMPEPEPVKKKLTK